MTENNLELVKALINTKDLLEIANKNFELSGNTELSDYYSYEIKALKTKHDYLLKQVKKAGITLDIVKRMNLKYNNVGA